ncbi:hypothetical protein CUU54_02445 [Pectobacterium polaris]|uniref:hypothetical protein n=1 Tax=Pectobacterium polaris TaxID=2042057 RepID=UPI000D61D4B7|nr:hypothetical protein [Pectobacterium polaris]MCU1787717.1 hypothetical protein [Pectobacterium polaris]PWD54851.1 hypothetical protein DF209_21420 [Pectobacterium polaris]
MKINKREAEYLRTAIIHGWEIYTTPWRTAALWDDDPIMPVKIGRVVEGLIVKGLFEKIPHGYECHTLRHTSLALTFKCNNRPCQKGKIYNGDHVSHDCPTCEGRGIILDNGQD